MSAPVPHFESDRLRLVPLVPGDAAAVYDDARDPLMYRYLQARPPATQAELEQLYARWSAGSPRPGETWLNWIAVERATGGRVGHLQATLDHAARSATIGYSIFRRYQRRGYGREAAAALIAVLRTTAGIDRAIAEISEPNVASRGIVERLGFAATGRILGTGREDGRICNDVVYTLELAGGRND